MRSMIVAACAVLAALPLSAQTSFDLSVPNIMRGPELVGSPPAGITWSVSGRLAVPIVAFRARIGSLSLRLAPSASQGFNVRVTLCRRLLRYMSHRHFTW